MSAQFFSGTPPPSANQIINEKEPEIKFEPAGPPSFRPLKSRRLLGPTRAAAARAGPPPLAGLGGMGGVAASRPDRHPPAAGLLLGRGLVAGPAGPRGRRVGPGGTVRGGGVRASAVAVGEMVLVVVVVLLLGVTVPQVP